MTTTPPRLLVITTSQRLYRALCAQYDIKPGDQRCKRIIGARQLRDLPAIPFVVYTAGGPLRREHRTELADYRSRGAEEIPLTYASIHAALKTGDPTP